MVVDWDPQVCFRDLPVWVHSSRHRKKLRFLTPGSRLLLNISRPENCTKENCTLQGYQAISGEWVALTPSLQFLRSPLESTLVPLDSKEGSTEIESRAGAYQEEELFRWSEHYQCQFRRRLVEQHLGPYLLSVVGRYQLQAGTTT